MGNGEVQHGEIPAWEDWALAESRRRYFAFHKLASSICISLS
jgi:hypothetical protein